MLIVLTRIAHIKLATCACRWTRSLLLEATHSRLCITIVVDLLNVSQCLCILAMVTTSVRTTHRAVITFDRRLQLDMLEAYFAFRAHDRLPLILLLR